MAATCIFVAGQAGKTKTRRLTNERAIDKSDYIFLEAAKYEAVDSLDGYYELLRRAYELNPADAYLGYDYGLYQVGLFHQTDSAQTSRGLSLMGRYVEQNPTDVNRGLKFASLTGQLRSTSDALGIYRTLFENSTDPSITGPAYASALAYTYNPDSVAKAISVIDRIEKYDGTSMELIGQKLKFYNIVNDTASILSETARLLATHPRSVEYLVISGDINMQFGQPDSALAYYNKAIDVDPTNGYAVYKRAMYYKETGDSLSFDREIFEAMRLPDLDVEDKLSILHEYVSELYADSTQRPRITSLFETMVSQYPHQEDVRSLYGSYLFSTGDREGAADQFSYAVNLNHDNQQLWTSLAQIYYMNNDYTRADATIKEAVKYFPEDVSLYLIGSSIGLQREDYDGAFGYLNRALEVADTMNAEQLADIYGAIGDVAYRKGDKEKAWMEYSKALQYNPESSMLLNNIAYYMACENIDMDKALEYIERALALEDASQGGNQVNTLDTYAWVLFKLKQYPKALEIMNRVLESDSDGSSAEVYEHAGDIYFMNGSPDEALDFWKKALEQDPDNELLKRKVRNKTFFFE